MPSTDTLLSLEADDQAVISFLDEFGGLLLRQVDAPGVYWAVMRPKSDPDELYYARVAWTAYPDQPASVRFHDGIGGSYADSRAWPQAPGYRVGSWDICKPLTAEGYALHREWASGPQAWSSAGNPFLWLVHALQNDLNHNYSGRHA